MGDRALRAPVGVPAPEREMTARDARAVVDACFDPSSHDRVGVECEWFVTATGEAGERVPAETVREICEHALAGDDACRVTFEPGGQLELSTLPARGIDAACGALARDASTLQAALAREELALVAVGQDAARPSRRVVDAPRYRAMERYFASEWPSGRTMMCSTAALQVNVDIGRADRVAQRWRLAHALGPMLAAAFANSPLACGRPSGWRSSRLAVWASIDPSRTAPVHVPDRSREPARGWEAYVLDARVMLVRRSSEYYEPVLEPLTFGSWMGGHERFGYPTVDDLQYHLTTLFPPVRPRGWLELRMIDSLPDPWWRVAVAVAVALLDDDVAAMRATRAVTRTESMWRDAACHAVAHPALGRAARDCFAAALDALPRLGAASTTVELVAEYRDRYVARGRCPADERLMEWTRDGTLLAVPEPAWGSR